jgi:hypothetical protein
MKKTIVIIFAAAALTACGTAKQVTQNNTTQTSVQTAAVQQPMDYVRKINDNAVYAKNIVSKVDVTLNAQGRDISVSGKLNMRRDEVVRITLTPFGLMEVGRLEFTPDYVLLINRMDKEYVKATYNEVDFLKANGLDFYTLQALFWNELFQPSKKVLSDADLSLYTADMSQPADRHITLKNGKLAFDWTTSVAKALITNALITYAQGTPQTSTVSMEYGDFVPMGSKRFPSREKVTFQTKAMNTGKLSLELKLNKITNDTDWESRTTVSDKYRKISAQQFFSKLGNM